MLPGIFIVLFFFALGELVGWLVNGFIPGSVIGMMLLFTALCLKWVKPERIKPVARFLCDNMALFFVPAGVGIVNALDILSQYWQAVLVACAVSTVVVISFIAVLTVKEKKIQDALPEKLITKCWNISCWQKLRHIYVRISARNRCSNL